jgi:hypothetical protein
VLNSDVALEYHTKNNVCDKSSANAQCERDAECTRPNKHCGRCKLPEEVKMERAAAAANKRGKQGNAAAKKKRRRRAAIVDDDDSSSSSSDGDGDGDVGKTTASGKGRRAAAKKAAARTKRVLDDDEGDEESSEDESSEDESSDSDADESDDENDSDSDPGAKTSSSDQDSEDDDDDDDGDGDEEEQATGGGAPRKKAKAARLPTASRRRGTRHDPPIAPAALASAGLSWPEEKAAAQAAPPLLPGWQPLPGGGDDGGSGGCSSVSVQKWRADHPAVCRARDLRLFDEVRECRARQPKPMAHSRAAAAAAALAPRLLPALSAAPIGDSARSFALNGGGSVRALDWCPRSAAAAGTCYLALGACPAAQDEMHVVGQRAAGAGCVQIWRFSAARASQAVAHTPSLALLLVHDGGAVWDLRWAPEQQRPATAAAAAAAAAASTAAPAAPQRLGLLAAALGDGSVRIFAVPEPAAAVAGATQVSALPPLAVLRMEDSDIWRVRWSLHGASTLLTGGVDGSVSLWQLPAAPPATAAEGAAAAAGLAPAVRFADAAAVSAAARGQNACVRDIAWSPTDGHIFAVLCGDTQLQLWDSRDCFRPLAELRVQASAYYGLALAWLGCGTRLVLAGDRSAVAVCVGMEKEGGADASMVQLLDAAGGEDVAVWAVDVQPSSEPPCVATCTGDGLLLVSHADAGVGTGRAPRKRDSYPSWTFRVGGMALGDGGMADDGDGGAAAAYIAEDIPWGAGEPPLDMSISGRITKAPIRAPTPKSGGGVLPAQQLALYTTRWGHGAARGWLAAGGSAGLVRCINLLGITKDTSEAGEGRHSL